MHNTKKGSTLLESLPVDEILIKIKKKSYQEVAEEYNTSRGTVWKLLRQNQALKYKDACLDDYKGVFTAMWACGRPIGKYRGKYPGGFLNRLANFINFDGKTILHLFGGSIQPNHNNLTHDIKSIAVLALILITIVAIAKIFGSRK